MDYHEQKIAKEMGHERHKPIATFFDHAVIDHEKSKKYGRTKYKKRVYLRKIPTAPDLVVRDVFDRPMMEEDKEAFPEAWKRYCERRSQIDNYDPPVTAIPGMSVAIHRELQDLDIHTCEQLVGHEGNLDEVEPIRETARKIMEISYALREERTAVRAEEGPERSTTGGNERVPEEGHGGGHRGPGEEQLFELFKEFLQQQARGGPQEGRQEGPQA